MKTAHTTNPKVIVMLGVHPASKQRGGIASVVDVYREGGLFTRWPILYLGTVASGSHLTKVRVAAAALWEYVRLLSTGRLALVHAHTSSRASFWRKSIFILIALAARKPVILHLHGGRFADFYNDECGAFRKALIRWILHHVDRVVVLSSQWQKLARMIAPAAKVVKIYNPIHAPAAARCSTQRLGNSLLFLGRLERAKGVFDLLAALAVIKSRFPAVQLHCGGEGDVASLMARASELGVDDCVNVLGWVNGAAKAQLLAEATIYVLPSHAEGLPMGILEAMAAGAPVVATVVGGIPDAIEDGVDGLLAPPSDINALANQIMRLLASPELRNQLAAAARIKARRLFSTEKVLLQLEDLYTNLGAHPWAPKTHEGGLEGCTVIRAHK